MATTVSFVVAATLMAMAGVLVSGQREPPVCIQYLYPCKGYVMMDSNQPQPSLECCDAFYTVTQHDLACLCSSLGDEPLLQPYGIDVAKTQMLPQMCKYNLDCSLSVGGKSDPSSSPPSIPSQGVTLPSQPAQPSLPDVPVDNSSEPSDAPPSEPPTVETPPPSASQPSIPAETPEAPGSEAPGSEAPESEAPGSEAPGSEAPESEAPVSEALSSTSPGSLPAEQEMPEAEASLAQGSEAQEATSHGISKKGATAMHGLVIGGILAGLFIAA